MTKWWIGLVLSGLATAFVMLKWILDSVAGARQSVEGDRGLAILAGGVMVFCLIMVMNRKNETK